MLLDRLVVLVPAQEEIDADLSEYGQLSNKCRSVYGEAAVQAGDPDWDVNGPRTSAVDAIANILHWLTEYDIKDAQTVLDSALMHFNAEVDGA